MKLIERLSGSGVQFFRDLAALATGQVLSKILGFLAFAWLARTLDPASYGAVEYLVGLSAFFAIVVDGGLGIIGTRRAVRQPEQIALLAFQIPTARLLLTAVAVPLMVLTAYVTGHHAISRGLIVLFAASLLTAPWRQQWMFQAAGRMGAVAKADLVRMAVFGALVWTLVRSPQDLILVGWAEVVSAMAMTVYCLAVQSLRITPIRLTGSLRKFGALLREGAVVGSTNFIWALTQAIPLMLVSAFLGGIAMAWFAGAARITGSILQFSNVYHFNLYPAVSQAHGDDDDTLAPLLRSSMRITAWAGVFVALVLTVLADPVVRLTLGAKLAAAAPVVQILAWSIPVALWSGHARWALAAAGAQRSVMLAQIAGLITTVLTGVAFGRFFGASGYAVGSVAGAIAVWIASHRAAVRHRCRPPPIHPILLPLALAGVIIACVSAFHLGLVYAALAALGYVASAPLFDRSLFKDVRALGATTLRNRGETAASSAA